MRDALSPSVRELFKVLNGAHEGVFPPRAVGEVKDGGASNEGRASRV